jgi:H+/gluconate symporter-like permease
VSLVVAVLMFALGQWYLGRAISIAVSRGEHFEARDQDRVSSLADAAGPGFKAAITPLVVTLLALNVLPSSCHWVARHFLSDSTLPWLHAVLSQFPEDATLAIFLGVAAGVIAMRRQLKDVWNCFGEGFVNGLLAVGSTSAVVGFGAAMKDLRSFQMVVDWVTHLPGDPLISAAIAMAVIAAIAGSASGGQGIALPIIKPIYVDQLGVAPRALHRIIAISSGSLDSLPANGYLVMLIRNICGETHAHAYGPIFVTTVLVPAAGTVTAIALFKWFPSWASM